MILSMFALSMQSQSIPAKLKKNKEYISQSGLKLTVYELNKKAPKADSADYIAVHYVGKLADGTIFDASYDRNMPIEFILGSGRVIKGWDEGLQYLHLGDSALLVIPPDIAYGSREKGKIPANSTLYFTVKIVELKKAIKPYNVDGLKVVELDSGLSYAIVSKGKGKGIVVGDKAFMHYTGYFVDGKKFDTSLGEYEGVDNVDGESSTFDFILGRHRVIDGWEIGLIGMKAGEKRRLNVPYHLAYGENGRPPIPAKSDLVFDVELIKFEEVSYPEFNIEGKDTIVLPSGLKYIIADSANGAAVHPNDTVIIKYTGYFMDGKIFDSSYDRGDTLVFVAAAQKVIKGLDEGMLLMKVGEKYRFIIPYELAYGEDGREPIIPAKSDLIFDVYLQDVKAGKKTF